MTSFSISRTIRRPRAIVPCLLLACCAAVFTSGCGDDRQGLVALSGQVLIDGQPLSVGSVRFVPEGSRASVGRLDQDGRFVLTCYKHGDGAAIGTHRVAVLASESISDDVIRWHAPKKLAHHKTSDIIVEVTEATDNLEIKISWEGGKPFNERD